MFLMTWVFSKANFFEKTLKFYIRQFLVLRKLQFVYKIGPKFWKIIHSNVICLFTFLFVRIFCILLMTKIELGIFIWYGC